jgi:hypothetical protein
MFISRIQFSVSEVNGCINPTTVAMEYGGFKLLVISRTWTTGPNSGRGVDANRAFIRFLLSFVGGDLAMGYHHSYKTQRIQEAYFRNVVDSR